MASITQKPICSVVGYESERIKRGEKERRKRKEKISDPVRNS